MKENKSAIVVTSINHPTFCLKEFSSGAESHHTDVIVIGDRRSPEDFYLENCNFLSLSEQEQQFPQFSNILPVNSYARKNIGYLVALKSGINHIIDTDDDNAPYSNFWVPRSKIVSGRLVERDGWVNAYAYFSDALIWPRGLPLDQIRSPDAAPPAGRTVEHVCPVQQGLADDNPDVDAVYRLILPLPIKFRNEKDIILSPGSWCPFNSQNTHWWPEAFPLMYLPSYCSFRMTDIWRSFVAQRILWANNWSVSFHSSTVYQDRNEHNLMRDFEQEVSGYINNNRIAETLSVLDIHPGIQNHGDNLRKCYSSLVKIGVIGPEELPLLDAWIEEVEGYTYCS
ncbi:DUF288 domain-containing protein (plasmid) [Azospirillum brasilense]|jgi:hypothetical protein|uniref:DUF288 domain-containing protein n=1 Tax=Azospirillum brasilense TaxID=192 RepID=A0A4D8QS63_AZOBR|nr:MULTISPECIES: STELLO glycosyltransferase family protein [Azospirillum]MDW7555714.1 STELLO glycosyltransferase family protein [Azospirillum brasilense]MDW7595851.1 STELLO glycosyltransferase family protein [Azospirillum brasilense]MDW7630856.1 STELLO glycosyltransferase family protein [Azospirillum brasilense]MDX5955764.1 STELLO glycosyltransferase family protein [Azospirillum brasilense]QCO13715.1 DUF288 domain-containing protein [Azospirillum brasilense]